MDQVIVVHVLGVEQVTILLLAEILRVDAVGPEEFLVCHAECLPDGLCDQLGLDSSRRGKTDVNRVAGLGAPGVSWACGSTPGTNPCQSPSSELVGTYFIRTMTTRGLLAFRGQESEMLDLLP